MELPHIVVPTRSLQVGVHTSFVREEPLSIRWLNKILAMCVVEDVSICLDIMTFEFKATLERPPFFTRV